MTDALNAKINTGSVWSPYQEFEVTIPAGGYQRINYVFDCFELLEENIPNAVQVNFGGAVNQTNFKLGMGWKLNEAVPYVQLHNSSTSTLIVKIALATGDIRDNRLVFEAQQINTQQTYSNLSVERITFDSSGEYTVSNPAKKVVLQNTGSATVYVGSATGFEISPSGSMDIELSGGFSIFGTAGETVVLGYYN